MHWMFVHIAPMGLELFFVAQCYRHVAPMELEMII